ncbi:phage holin family protein [Shewanella putrefaciens]|uniref:phage holin family protein n=1 Tax=Shewanella putrefaciens TaxID=24 RepID=UPI0018E8829E
MPTKIPTAKVPTQTETIAESLPNNNTSLSGLLTQFIQQVRIQCRQQLQLLTLEIQRAAESLVAMCILGFFIALLLLSTWVLSLQLLWLGLQAIGLLPWQGILLLWLLQLLAIFVCVRLIRYHSRFLRFPATIESLSVTKVETATSSPQEPRSSNDV